MQAIETLIQQAYSAFNKRDIDGVLLLMTPDVHWPNGWEGGYVFGTEAVREYWSRQWKELDPRVDPIEFVTDKYGRVVVTVHALVRDMDGEIVSDGNVVHAYQFENKLIKRMEIRSA